MTAEKIKGWIEDTSFTSEEGLCKQKGTVSVQSVKTKGSFVSIESAEDSSTVNLVKLDEKNLGCDAWLACFSVSGTSDNYVIEAVSQTGQYLVFDGSNLKKDASNNSYWKFQEL